MANPCYFKVEGVDGSCPDKGFEKFTYVYELHFRHYFEFDPRTALRTGDQKGDPYQLLCKLDEATNEWFQKFRKGTHFNAEIRFRTKTKEGSDLAYFTIKLEQAIFTEVEILCPNVHEEGQHAVGHYTKVGLAARKFTLTHEKFNETEKISRRKNSDAYDHDNPTG